MKPKLNAEQVNRIILKMTAKEFQGYSYFYRMNAIRKRLVSDCMENLKNGGNYGTKETR